MALPVTKKYLELVASTIGSGSITQGVVFNGDTSNNYAYRKSSSGAADTTAASTSSINITSGDTGNVSVVRMFILNRTSSEKFVYGSVSLGPSGASNVPPRVELSGKWANTSVQITSISIVNSNTGDFASGSELVVLGKD